MWYFTWVLGVGFACAFAILNAMWLEVHEDTVERRRPR
jgi:cyd operon protein YbgT